MLENQKAFSLDKQNQIEWEHYNYPPLLKIMHFRSSEVPEDRRFLVLSLFALHIASIPICILNFIINCIEGGIGVLYSILFSFVFVSLLLYLFYLGFTGICKKQASLKIFLIAQPIAISIEMIATVGNFLGFNGFLRVSQMFSAGQGAASVFSLVISLAFLTMAIFSVVVFFRVVRQSDALRKSLM